MIDKQKILSKISLLLVCALLGFVVSIQFKSVQFNNGSSTPARYEELQKMYLAEQEKNASLQDQITQMQTTINSYRESIEQTGTAYKGMEADLLRAENLAGLTDVYGPGITITLSDAKNTDPTVPPEYFIIHDSDVRSLVNELLAAGAEAISINDERVVSTTAIRCVGPVIIVNNSRSSTPFVIKAIGDSATLESAINMTGGVLSELRQWNIGVAIQKSSRIDMKAYSGSVTFKHVTTAKNKEE